MPTPESSMVYVFDTNSLRVFGNYYPESFPSFWQELMHLVLAGRVVSVREVKKELELQNPIEHLNDWAVQNTQIFTPPSSEEMEMVAEIFLVNHFKQLIGEKQRLKGLPVADPFLVARGRLTGACVVTEEARKPNAAKIPNVCDHFQVRSTDVRGFLAEVGWRF